MVKNSHKKIIDSFNKNGSFAFVQNQGSGFWIPLGVLDSLTVIQSAGDSFWLCIKQLEYNAGPQSSHVVLIASWYFEDDWELFMTTEKGTKIQLEMIVPDSNPREYEIWKDWLKRKRDNPERLFYADKVIKKLGTDLINEYNLSH